MSKKSLVPRWSLGMMFVVMLVSLTSFGFWGVNPAVANNPSPSASSAPIDLTILHTNDFHARVDQYNRNGAICSAANATAGLCIGGVPRLSTVVSEVRNTTDNVLLLDAGDQFQGTLFYNLFKSDVLTTTMNYLGYDAMAIGNHEFDNGPEELARFINGANFPVLSANIDASNEPLLDGLIAPTTIITESGRAIGIIGLTTPDTSNISSPGPNVVFNPLLESLQAAADALTAQGVDKIIALTHVGYEIDLDLAAQVSGVDVIIGGHSHSFLYNPTAPISFANPIFPQFGPLNPAGAYPTVVTSAANEPVLVATAYQWGTFLGRLDVSFDADGLITAHGGNPIYLGNDVAKDPVADALLQPYRDGIASVIATPIGTTTVDLLINAGGQQICRLGECLMGNLVADAMLWKANQVEPTANYQIAFQNGGGLRAPIPAGPVSLGNVLETLPFGNAIATFELQGQYVKAALENGARLYPSANGGFAQVAGLRYDIDPTQPAQARVFNVEVWNGAAWEPLDMSKMYKVVTNDFMRRGGDNYTVFRDRAVNPYDFGPALDEALADYFQAFSPITPVLEDRITIGYDFAVTLLHTNDFHARVDQFNRNGAICSAANATDGLCIGGVPRLSTVVSEVRNTTDNVLLLDAGDQFQGTLFYNLFKSDVLTTTMNYLGYDAMAIGNHEFDNGPEELARFINGANFPVLSANIDASNEPLLDGLIAPTTIITESGRAIGIIGLTTPDTSNISSPGPNVVFNPLLESLQAAADALTAQGVDKIIALTHVGYEIDLDLAAQVSGVDVIIGGHSHSFLYNPTAPISFANPIFPQFGPLNPAGAYPTVVTSAANEPVLVATAYQWGTFLGRLDVSFDADGLITSHGGNPIYLGNGVAKDPVADALLQPFRNGVASLIATPVGSTTVDLLINAGGQQICRLGECLMGNLVADAMLWKANQVEPTANYQIAFQNGGGLRAPIPAGPVSLGNVLETLPFGNAIATFELQGQYVKAALENGARLYPSANGGFAQVSGLRYKIDPTKPAQARVLDVEVWNGTAWEALDMDKMYKVVTNDFMRRGGDNYTMFRDQAVNPYDFGPALDEALADYFRTFSPVTPMIEGRITLAEYGLALTTANSTLGGLAGSTVTYTLQLTNTGNVTDTFSFEATGNTWQVSVPMSVTLGAGASTTVEVAVTIPEDAAADTNDTVTVTATSAALPTATDSVELTTTAEMETMFTLYLPLVGR
ncbi:MAG: 5'-nucleotidase C-terminal domain-containing protein [Oscillochloridaceae bacterium umkhey_bin13]